MSFNFERALDRIGPHIRQTPLIAAEEGFYLKAENRQITGSFKLRGALNKLLKEQREAIQNGVLAASAGNHGLGVAYAARQLGARCTIVVPTSAVKRKVDGMQDLGARVIFAEGGYGGAERMALQLKSGSDMVWVSPYNDFDVVEGQGTIGIEIVEELPDIDELTIYIPASGGGLASGIGFAVRELRPGWRTIGVQTAAAPYLAEHFAGKDMAAVVEANTIADGLAGPVEDGSATLEWIVRAVDGFEVVEEDQILAAMRWVHARTEDTIEPSAAVGVAAFKNSGRARRAVAIVSGGNVDPGILELALAQRPD